MINIITIIIASTCLAIVWADISPFMPWLKNYLKDKGYWYKKGFMFEGQFRHDEGIGSRFTKRLKPFDCSQCMSLWTCLTATLCYGYSLPISIAMACVSCVFTTFVSKQIKP